MNKRKMRMAALVLSAGLSGAAQAALHDRGGGLIYDDVLNVTWLQDANAARGSSYDSADGLTDGRTTWKNSVDWAANLSYYDSIRNVTYTDWRLPTTTDTGALGCNDTYSGTDCGYNVNTATGEMAQFAQLIDAIRRGKGRVEVLLQQFHYLTVQLDTLRYQYK